MTVLSETQKRYKLLFENHVDTKTGEIFNKEFERDILKLRAIGAGMTHHDSGEKVVATPLRRLLVKYGFPYLMHNFIYLYALNGTVDYEQIISGLLLVCEVDGVAVGAGNESEAYEKYKSNQTLNGDTDLKLIINPNSTKKEVMQFLDIHWESFVKPRAIEGVLIGTPERIREHYNAKRDYRVLELLEDHKPKDVSIMISKEYPGYTPTYVDFAKIKKRRKPKNITI